MPWLIQNAGPQRPSFRLNCLSVVALTCVVLLLLSSHVRNEFSTTCREWIVEAAWAGGLWGGYSKWRDNDLKDALTVKWSSNVMGTTHTCSLWGRRVTSIQGHVHTRVLPYNHQPRSNVWRNADTISFYRVKAAIPTSSSLLHHSFLPTKKRKICINLCFFPERTWEAALHYLVVKVLDGTALLSPTICNLYMVPMFLESTELSL